MKTYNINGAEVIYCPTMKDKKRVARCLNKLGYRWHDGKTYKEKPLNVHSDCICPKIGLTLSRDLAIESKAKIINASDFIERYETKCFNNIPIRDLVALFAIILFVVMSFICFEHRKYIEALRQDIVQRDSLIHEILQNKK